VRILLTRWLRRFARKEGIDDATLCHAVQRAEDGYIDADPGGGVIKQRIAREGGGKSGGYRAIIIYRAGDRALFAYGFPKSERENITQDELNEYRAFAKVVLSYTDAAIDALVKSETWNEVRP